MLQSSDPLSLAAIDLEYNPLFGGNYFIADLPEDDDIRPF